MPVERSVLPPNHPHACSSCGSFEDPTRKWRDVPGAWLCDSCFDPGSELREAYNRALDDVLELLSTESRESAYRAAVVGYFDAINRLRKYPPG